MSMDSCKKCGAPIDTDEMLECYGDLEELLDAALAQAHCEACTEEKLNKGEAI